MKVLKEQGITLMVVAVGKNVNSTALYEITSIPKEINNLQAEDYESLNRLQPKIVSSICSNVLQKYGTRKYIFLLQPDIG